MDVFVIPVGTDRYELYYEQATEVEPEDEPVPTGMFANLQRRFRELLRAAEQHRGEEEATHTDSAPRTWTGRMQDRMMAWIARRIAEQRLLWNLRKVERVVAVHPADTTFDAVMPHIQRALQREFERHRFWLFIDAAGLIVSGLLAVLPGPNLIAYYFLFRVGGHWLSLRGALHGRQRVVWDGRSCDGLDGLREALNLPRRERQTCVQEVASALHLPHLPTFFDRVTQKTDRSE